MPRLETNVDTIAAKWIKADEGQLYEQLGIRIQAITKDLNIAGSLEPHVVYDGSIMGPLDDVRELGRRVFKRWNKEAHELICGTKVEDRQERESVLAALGGGDVAVAAALTALLIHVGLAPALAPVVAAIVAKRFFHPAYDEFCAIWKENL
jgi:hypothetical protein